MKRFAIAALAVVALGAVIAGAQVVTNPQIPPNTVCSYLTSPPTLTDGQASWLRCDATGQLITTASGGGGGGAATIADGADVTEGAIADAAVTAGATGTVSAKLRSISRDIATVISNTAAPIPLPTASGNATTGAPCGGNTAVSSCVLKASAGNLMSVYATCTAACYLMVFNSTSAPSNGNTTAGNASGNMMHCVFIAAGATGGIAYSIFPGAFSVGAVAAISNQAGGCGALTLTASGSMVRGEVI